MTISDIRLELQINGVDAKDIDDIIASCKTKGYGVETLDDELEKRGYDKVFTVDYEFDDAEEWDDDFSSIEPFPHRHQFDDD